MRELPCGFRLALLGLASSLILVPTFTAAQTIRDDLFVTNGTVNAIKADNGVLYIGGSFTQVGPATGNGVPLNSTGQPVALPKVAGTVYAVAPDGGGGWYLGGEFESVNGKPRSRLAHLLADNSLAPWNPGADGAVRALVVSGGTLYVGGDFTTIAGGARDRIAAVNGSTGVVTSWNPSSNGTVDALIVSGSTIYAAGSFTHIGGQNRNRVAGLESASGNATGWDPGANGIVRALVVSGGVVYAGGDFSTFGGASRARIAAVDASGGDAIPNWNPAPMDPCTRSPWMAGRCTRVANSP